MPLRLNHSGIGCKSCALLGVAIAGTYLLSGCSSGQLRPTALNCLIMVPPNMMTGELWDVEPLSWEELTEFLTRRMPRPDEVPAEMGEVEAFESFCGKRVVWIPREARPSRSTLPSTYRGLCKWSRQSPLVGPMVGEYLEGMLASVTPAPPEPAEGGAEGTAGEEGWVYIALITKKNLIIVLVPRDYTHRSIPEVFLPEIAK